MKISPIYVEKNLRPRGGGFDRFARIFALALFGVILVSFSGNAQIKKKYPKDPISRTVKTVIPKSESKLKTFDEYSEFVIADFRAGAVEEVVEADDSQTLKQELQEKFPISTVFGTTHSKVCIIGVEGTASANTILKAINTKASKIVKKADLDKALSISNVKVVKKEEL
jgi:hypothetical protein